MFYLLIAIWIDSQIKCNAWTWCVPVYLQKSSRESSIEKEAAESEEKMKNEPSEEKE